MVVPRNFLSADSSPLSLSKRSPAQGQPAPSPACTEQRKFSTMRCLFSQVSFGCARHPCQSVQENGYLVRKTKKNKSIRSFERLRCPGGARVCAVTRHVPSAKCRRIVNPLHGRLTKTYSDDNFSPGAHSGLTLDQGLQPAGLLTQGGETQVETPP